MGELGCGLSKSWAPRPLVARLLPGWKTLLHTLSLRTEAGVVGVTGVVGVPGLAGMDMDLWNLLVSPPPPTEIKGKYHPWIQDKLFTSNWWLKTWVLSALVIPMVRGLVLIFLSLPRPRSGWGPATTSSHILSSNIFLPPFSACWGLSEGFSKVPGPDYIESVRAGLKYLLLMGSFQTGFSYFQARFTRV